MVMKRMLPLIVSSKLEGKTVDGKFLRICFEAFLYFRFFGRDLSGLSASTVFGVAYEVGEKIV